MNVYLDHAATTPVSPKALGAMLPYFSELYANASSQHQLGIECADAVAAARRIIATCIGAEEDEIFFTSCGSEADNWAIKGAALANIRTGRHIITSAIEHPAVCETCKQLESLGFDITYLPVNSEGFVSPEDLVNAIRPDTILVSIMLANNEIGTIEPIKELCEIAHTYGVLFHTDAVQATGAISYNVKDLGVDLLSMSAHKFYGPKGVGVLYKKSTVTIGNLINGGEQEQGLRAGTINTPGIVGTAVALNEAMTTLEADYNYVQGLRDCFVNKVLATIDGVIYNGPKDEGKKLPNNSNFVFEGVDGQNLLFALDMEGIAASAGSACSSGSLTPSRTLTAIGLSPEAAMGGVRFAFGKHNTMDEVNYVATKLAEIVTRLRSMTRK